MSTELQKPKASPLAIMGSRFNIDPGKLLDVLKGTVIRATDKHTPTNEEVASFVIVANQYGLNPFTREIHAFVSQAGVVVPIVGIDGWVRLANSRPEMDGVEFDYINGTNDVGVKCTMHIKGRSKPTVVTEWLSECKRNTAPWNTMPKRMLRHRAFMQCARLAFGFAGIYDEEEGRIIVEAGPDPLPVVAENGAEPKQAKTEALADRLKKQRKPKEPEPEPEKQANGAATAAEGEIPLLINAELIELIRDEARRQFGERTWAAELGKLVHQVAERRNLEDVLQTQGEEILEILRNGVGPEVHG